MSITQHIPLVLASASPVRAQLLKSVGLEFSVAPSSVDEADIKRLFLNKAPRQMAAALAQAKAKNVSVNYPDALTIGADQLCMMKPDNLANAGERHTIFSKPETADNARTQLQQLSGNTHRQISAVCIMRGQEVIWEEVDVARLTTRHLTEIEIAAYVNADQPLQSCGAYKYEGLGKHLFIEVKGEASTIQGLPLVPLLAELHRQGAISLA